MVRICIPERPGQIGGPASFKRKLQQGLEKYAIEVVYDREDGPYDLVLVVAGTRHVGWLRSCKAKGIPIVHRLDGFHCYRKKASIISKHRWVDAARNRIVQVIRDRLADHVIYQSEFTRDWWHREHGHSGKPESIVINGVDTDRFCPSENGNQPSGGISMVTVEGSFGMHERIVLTPVDTWRALTSRHDEARLSLIGELPAYMKRLIPTDRRVRYDGIVPNDTLPEFLRSATVFLSAEVNPACPNSVIEALACGAPVVAFDTGALREIVTDSAGVIVPYGGNSWTLDEPDIQGLAEAVEMVHADYAAYSRGARELALQRYTLDRMVAGYVAVFEQALGRSLQSVAAEQA